VAGGIRGCLGCILCQRAQAELRSGRVSAPSSTVTSKSPAAPASDIFPITLNVLAQGRCHSFLHCLLIY